MSCVMQIVEVDCVNGLCCKLNIWRITGVFGAVSYISTFVSAEVHCAVAALYSKTSLMQSAQE
jgi:hypothetical protein